jgi:hypothetical protein
VFELEDKFQKIERYNYQWSTHLRTSYNFLNWSKSHRIEMKRNEGVNQIFACKGTRSELFDLLQRVVFDDKRNLQSKGLVSQNMNTLFQNEWRSVFKKSSSESKKLKKLIHFIKKIWNFQKRI